MCDRPRAAYALPEQERKRSANWLIRAGAPNRRNKLTPIDLKLACYQHGHVSIFHQSIRMAPTQVYLSVARGDANAHSAAVKAHQEVADWLKKNASNYGLPNTIHELDDVQKETVQSMYEGENVSRDYRTQPLPDN